MLRSEPHRPYTFISINLMDGRRGRDRMVFGLWTKVLKPQVIWDI